MHINRKSSLNKKGKSRIFHIVACLIILAPLGISILNAARRYVSLRVLHNFCAVAIEQYQEKPGRISPNYMDHEWCYFWAADEWCIYRIKAGMKKPELVIKDACGSLTVTEQGILFLRKIQDNYIGDMLWSTRYDLMLWQDGTETTVWKDAPISFEDGSIATVGDHLIYRERLNDGIYTRRLRWEVNHYSLGYQRKLFPGGKAIQSLLWADGASIWYAVDNVYGTVPYLRRLDLVTQKYSKFEISFRGNWDLYRIHQVPFAVCDGNLYYPLSSSNGAAVMQLDLAAMTSCQLSYLPEKTAATIYGTLSGECLLRSDNYSTTALNTDIELSFIKGQTVHIIFEDFVIAYEYELYDGYCYLPRSVLYQLDSGTELWRSNGEHYWYKP